MEEPLKLAVTFLEHASVRVVVPEDPAELERLLRGAWETGRQAWPRLAVPADSFVRHLAQRLSKDSEGLALVTVLEALALGDLYLACACMLEIEGAIEALEANYLAKVQGLLGYLKLPEAVLDDVCQSVRIHLLMGTSESGPRLGEYTGRGSLLSWIRVIAARMALKRGPEGRETPKENILEVLEGVPAPGPDAELDLIKRRYRHEFRQALSEAFALLSSEQRYLLKLHFFGHLPTTELGPLFRVNQSTISRWLKTAREAVFEETKRLLQERLNLSSQEFQSMVEVIKSQFDLSLSQILEEEEKEQKEEGKRAEGGKEEKED